MGPSSVSAPWCLRKMATPISNLAESSRTLDRDVLHTLRIVEASAGPILLSAPFHRVQILLQTQDSHPLVTSKQQPRYSGIFNCFKRVIQEQGIVAFWRGTLPRLLSKVWSTSVGVIIGSRIKDEITVALKNTYTSDAVKNNALSSLGAAITTAAITLPTSIVTQPLAVASTQLTAEVRPGAQQHGLRASLLRSWTNGGVVGLYFTPTWCALLGTFLARFGYFFTNDLLLECLPPEIRKHHGLKGIVAKFACAQTAVITGAFIAYPTSTIGARLQLQVQYPLAERTYPGGRFEPAFHAIRKIATTEGIRGFYRGYFMKLLTTVGTSVALVVYGELKALQ